MLPSYSRYSPLFKTLRMPCAYVDWDLLRANARLTLIRARGLPVRIASKSIRSAWIIKKILEEFPGFSGILAYSAKEAAYLFEQGLDDILIAYPTVETEDINAVMPHIKMGRKLIFIVDHHEHVSILQTIARRHQQKIAIAIDIDLSLHFPFLYFGVYRSPIKSRHDLKVLVDTIMSSSSIELVGLMGYEAQFGHADFDQNRRGISATIRMLKKIGESRIHRKRCAAVNYLKSRDVSLQFVNGGGTGSLESTVKDPCVTELSAGSAFFGPSYFDHFARFKLYPAAGFVLPVTRIPRRGVVTCHGGGYIASGPNIALKNPQPFLPSGLSLFKYEGAGEVQTPLKTSRNLDLNIGDPIFFRHSKSGELAEHFNAFHIFSDGKIIAHASTYRGDGHAFL